MSNIGVNLDGTYYPPKNPLVPGIQKGGVPVLFGGVVIIDMEKQAYWNAAVLASKDGKVLDTYGKMHPVPFAESIPFYELAPVQEVFPERGRDLEPLGERHPPHRLPRSPRARGERWPSACRSASRTRSPTSAASTCWRAPTSW